MPSKGRLLKMADKTDKNLSVDDILEQYSSKVPKNHTDDTLDIDSILNEIHHTPAQKTEMIEDVLEIGDNSYVFDPGDEPQPQEQDIPPQPSDEIRTSSGVRQGTAAIEDMLENPQPKQPPKADESTAAHAQEKAPQIRPVTGRNADTAIMQGLLKLKSERGTAKPAQKKVDPVNRASISDIDLGIEKKVIPSTEVGIDENASEEEKLAYLNAKRKERVKEFVARNEEEEKPQKGSVADFESFDQAQKMSQSISGMKSSLVVRLCVLLVLSVVSSKDVSRYPMAKRLKERSIITNHASKLLTIFSSQRDITSILTKFLFHFSCHISSNLRKS